MPLLYGLLQSETEALQAAAAEVLTEIVGKRMDAEAKLQLVQQLGLAPVAAAWRDGLPGSADGELPLRTARLLAALCNGGVLCLLSLSRSMQAATPLLLRFGKLPEKADCKVCYCSFSCYNWLLQFEQCTVR